MKHTLNINNNYMNDNSEKLQLTKYCEWRGCNKKGIYRAPKNRDNLREFRWFCLEHIREYNKNSEPKFDKDTGVCIKEGEVIKEYPFKGIIDIKMGFDFFHRVSKRNFCFIFLKCV